MSNSNPTTAASAGTPATRPYALWLVLLATAGSTSHSA